MNYKERDSNISSRFHPLLFAIVASIVVLLITAIVSYIAAPKLPFHLPFLKPSPVRLSQVKKAPWKTVTIQPNDNLATIFKREKLNMTDYYAIIKLDPVKKAMQTLKPKYHLYFLLNKNKQLEKMVYIINHAHFLEVDRQGKQFKAKIIAVKLNKKMSIAKGIINQSFALAAHRAGLTSSMVATLSDVFGWQINFSHSIQKGDKFVVLYDAYYDHAKKIKSGDILAAEFINRNKEIQAIRYKTVNGHVGYYTPVGKNLKHTFMRAPIRYKYVSSPFNAKRMHPILHIIRPHEGVDLAAPTGTPIHASGDGRITFRGRRGGYGKCIMIKNGMHYSTVFAHMSRFSPKFHVGSYVKEGQIIGYVGQTGLATGPHLHYEFHVNGIPRNPMTVKLPTASPIPTKERKQFLVYAKKMVRVLDREST